MGYLDNGLNGLHRKLVMHGNVEKTGIDPMMGSPDNRKSKRAGDDIAPT